MALSIIMRTAITMLPWWSWQPATVQMSWIQLDVDFPNAVGRVGIIQHHARNIRSEDDEDDTTGSRIAWGALNVVTESWSGSDRHFEYIHSKNLHTLYIFIGFGKNSLSGYDHKEEYSFFSNKET